MAGFNPQDVKLGNDILLYLQLQDETYVPIAYSTSSELQIQSDNVGTSNKESGIFSDSQQRRISWTVRTSTLIVDTSKTNVPFWFSLMKERTLLNIRIGHCQKWTEFNFDQDTTKASYEGTVYVTNLSVNLDNGSAAQLTVDLVGVGELISKEGELPSEITKAPSKQQAQYDNSLERDIQALQQAQSAYDDIFARIRAAVQEKGVIIPSEASYATYPDEIRKIIQSGDQTLINNQKAIINNYENAFAKIRTSLGRKSPESTISEADKKNYDSYYTYVDRIPLTVTVTDDTTEYINILNEIKDKVNDNSGKTNVTITDEEYSQYPARIDEAIKANNSSTPSQPPAQCNHEQALEDIRAAIIQKGVNPTGDYNTYASAILRIETGSDSTTINEYEQIFAQIKQAIENKGVTVTGGYNTYPSRINAIQNTSTTGDADYDLLYGQYKTLQNQYNSLLEKYNNLNYNMGTYA